MILLCKEKCMRKLSLWLFLLLSVNTLAANTESLNESYELTGLKNPGDVAMIQALNGDDYFIATEMGEMKIKVKKREDLSFTDHVQDFSWHNFDQFKALEAVRFSNYRDYLFFIAVKEGVESLNVLSFDENNIPVYRNDLKLDFEPGLSIDYLKIVNLDRDNALIIYSSDDQIYTRRFENDFKTSEYLSHEDLGISGELVNVFYHKDFYRPEILKEVTYIVKASSGEFELWKVSIYTDQIKAFKAAQLTEAQAMSFRRVLENDSLYNVSYDPETLTYYRFNDMESTLYEFPRTEAERGYYYVDEQLIYGVYNSVTRELFSLKDFYTVETSSPVIKRDNILNASPSIEFKEGSFYLSGNQIVHSDFENPSACVFATFLDGLLIAGFHDAGVLKVGVYHFEGTDLIEKQYFRLNSVQNTDFSDLHSMGGLIRLGDSGIYYSVWDNEFFISERVPVLLEDYILSCSKGQFTLLKGENI